MRSRALCGSKRAQFVYDSVICRHLVVLLEDAEALAPSALTESPRKAPLPDSEVEARVAFMLARGMRVSHDTAKYYLREAQGDIQRAFHLLGVPSPPPAHPQLHSCISAATCMVTLLHDHASRCCALAGSGNAGCSPS